MVPVLKLGTSADVWLKNSRIGLFSFWRCFNFLTQEGYTLKSKVVFMTAPYCIKGNGGNEIKVPLGNKTKHKSSHYS